MQSWILRRPKQEKKNKLRQFIGIVNYYRNMWFRRSELLARIHWLASHQARSSLNGTHPINKPLIKSRKSLERRYFSAIQNSISLISSIFTLTDASDHQLGAVIMQDKKPIDFYSRKLNTAQKLYTTTEKERELLSAIETCKEYKNILLGYHWPIIVFTYHKSNTFNGLKASDRVLHTCWLLLLEENWVIFEYLPGKLHKHVAVVADALSSLDIDSLKIQEEEVLTLL
jgi:hypothetical protein